ncbi:MAG TPA: glutamine--fructose-6-phosphate transaminase (isomerizing), partial [Clostridiales bacterium]|nr:glutamine--fructose-6-phosphate transaminase (isomerizing) [Clostridiales bacterium]
MQDNEITAFLGVQKGGARSYNTIRLKGVRRMCGIIGYVGHRQAVPVLLKGLKALEYRGYDSSGVALHTGASLSIVKRAGRLANLEKAIEQSNPTGCLGIGHTRWATHGVATDLNAHPFLSTYGKFAVVHNGIIANYLSLAASLRERGVNLTTDTDSEVVAHLIDHYYTGDVLSAVCRAARELKGSFALGVISVYEPNVLYGVRKDSPLVVGAGVNENAICSDISGISDFCGRLYAMQNGEIARVSTQGISLYDFYGKSRSFDLSPQEKEENSEREENEDYMHCEIRQTPLALLSGYESFPEKEAETVLSKPYDEILLVGCGSAYHAGLVFKGAMRELADTQVREEIASEYLTQKGGEKRNALVVAVSQSGETADTLLAVEKAKRQGATVLSVCNVRASSLVRLSDLAIITRCGRERAVAATKSYVAQVHSLLLLCLKYAEIKGKISKNKLNELKGEIAALPEKAERVIEEESYLSKVALAAKDAEAVFFLGRGQDCYAAKEGSLKLKEISYLFSEAYPSGELKHGTLALMEKGVYGVVIATDPALAEKNAATVAEITCRGASA